MIIENSPNARGQLIGKIFQATQSVTNAPVQPDFKLVQDTVGDTEPMEEFVSDRLGGRFIAVASDSDIAYKHAVLSEEGLPVLSGMYTPNQLLLLQVPSGTRAVAGYMHSIRRNPTSYRAVFQEIGMVFGELEQHDHGQIEPNKDYSVLRQFALVADETADTGGRVYLMPPYNLGDFGREHALAAIAGELVDSGIVQPEQAAYLIEQVNQGWHTDDQVY